jgi:uncharacterized protein
VSVIFLDTVGLVAVWNKTDQWHQAAKQAHDVLMGRNIVFVTTSYVLLECGNAVARGFFRNTLVNLRNELLKSDSVIEPTEEDIQKAWSDFSRGRPGSAGIVDCISFAVMRRLGISEVFTNDQHFQAAGFKTLF